VNAPDQANVNRLKPAREAAQTLGILHATDHELALALKDIGEHPLEGKALARFGSVLRELVARGTGERKMSVLFGDTPAERLRGEMNVSCGFCPPTVASLRSEAAKLRADAEKNAQEKERLAGELEHVEALENERLEHARLERERAARELEEKRAAYRAQRDAVRAAEDARAFARSDRGKIAALEAKVEALLAIKGTGAGR
jgi:hypothetical protein